MARGMVVGFGVFVVTRLVYAPEFCGTHLDSGLRVARQRHPRHTRTDRRRLAEKFDQIAAFQNFFIMPLTFLSGVFYSVKSLPAFWQSMSHLNPFFYMVDGFRYGFFGQSDASPWTSLAVVSLALLVVAAIALRMLASGFKTSSLTDTRRFCRTLREQHDTVRAHQVRPAANSAP